jgi:hypothetical protein
MTDSQPNLLSDHSLVRCLQCGADVWDYPTPNGKHVALDNAPGPWVIDGGKAYKSPGNHGYRGHWDHCERLAASPLTGQVNADEFLWS